jgi:monovalent cation/hydrogen antiporter
VFLLTGLQARALLEKSSSFSIRELLIATAITTAIVIAARFAWVFPATYLPRWLSPSLRKRDPYPPWQAPFAIAFTGVRGVVSLAAALAIPLVTANGAPFPQRDLILFVAFGVIVITLVGQGLMLPSVMRRLGLVSSGREEQQQERQAELAARAEAIEAALRHLEKVSADRKLSGDALDFLRARHDHRIRQLPKDLGDGLAQIRFNNDLRMELIAAEREFLYELLRAGKITDESRRRLERELDLEEATILSKRESETPL